MSGEWPQAVFPKLTDTNTEVTSCAANKYNCIAWAAGENFRFWWPDPDRVVAYWPHGVQREETLEAFMGAFRTLGDSACEDSELEAGIEKIALFGMKSHGIEVPTHAARQLESGKWTSKLGVGVDIAQAKADDVSGPAYGEVVCYMSRVREAH